MLFISKKHIEKMLFGTIRFCPLQYLKWSLGEIGVPPFYKPTYQFLKYINIGTVFTPMNGAELSR